MKIYIDADYKCHTTNDGTMREFEVEAFDSKCKAYIEGTRYIPSGETWVRSDGKVFNGEMISPCIDSRIRDAYQEMYEASATQLAEYEAALSKIEAALGV